MAAPPASSKVSRCRKLAGNPKLQEVPMASPAGTFLMNCWYVAAWDYELAGDKLLERTLLEHPVVLYKRDSGKVVALDNRSAHRRPNPSNGRREGERVRCMYHSRQSDPSGK